MQTDAKGKEKAEGSMKSEELADSIGGLSIGPGRTNFKKKPVIIIVIGMAGASNSTVLCLIDVLKAWIVEPTCDKSLNRPVSGS